MKYPRDIRPWNRAFLDTEIKSNQMVGLRKNEKDILHFYQNDSYILVAIFLFFFFFFLLYEDKKKHNLEKINIYINLFQFLIYFEHREKIEYRKCKR